MALMTSSLRHLTAKHTLVLIVSLLGALAPAAGAAPVYDYNTGAQSAWDAGFTGTGQNVAVVDSGIDATNPWIASQVVKEACVTTQTRGGAYPFCSDPDHQPVWGPLVGPGTAFPVTYTGVDTSAPHGTAVAGAVAGAEQRGEDGPIGWRGIAPDAGIIGLNANMAIGATDGTGPEHVGLELEDSMLWLDAHRAELGLSVVNISASGTIGTTDGPCDTWARATPARARKRAAIYRLISHGVPVVVAAGNEKTREMGFPACLARVISVSGVYPSSGTIADDVNISSQITLLAPSEDIRVPSLSSRTTIGQSGTSFAAPIVSGAIALYLQRHPGASPAAVKRALQDTGIPTRVRKGLVKPRIQIDKLLGLDRNPTGSADAGCLRPEFFKAPGSKGDYEGAVRFLCRPSVGAPTRVAVVVDGPGFSKVAAYNNVQLHDDQYYKTNVVRLLLHVKQAKAGTYRTCFLYYGTEDDVWPAAKDCRYDEV